MTLRASNGQGPKPFGAGAMFELITSIVVDLSDQKLYAYNGAELVRAIAVSSGKAGSPTPTFRRQVQ